MVRGRASGVPWTAVGVADHCHARRSCPLNVDRQFVADLRVTRMSWHVARVWVAALSLASVESSPVEGQLPRAPRDSKRLASPNITCVVAKLADGDSFTCADGREVRLLLIDTPELAQAPWGQMAKRQLETMVRPGTAVRLEVDRMSVDRYQRTLAYVWVDTVMVNEAMVARGWAVVLAYENVRHLDRMKRAECEAQAAKRGFWQAWAFRCRPVDFRARRCGASSWPQRGK
ncbi:MAG: hypothetical protein C0497_13180 [Gemmatimonas sp.]|nr:hypothetical protein [Gemmatimonas sp.]